MNIKVSDFVINFIAGLGVKHLFLLPGGGCMHLVDSLGRNKDLIPVCYLHEQAAVIAAEAYGQYTSSIGVALVTTGPGGTNAITGVAGAWIDSTPLLVISGQVKTSDMIGDRGVRQMGIQEVDIVRLISPITKYAVTVIDPLTIKWHLEKAVYLAKTGRPGPVWIDIPLDVQGANIDTEDLIKFTSEKLLNNIVHSDVRIGVQKAITLLNRSERPVILAGNGIRLSHGLKDFLNLIKILSIPILTTWKAIDFVPENHELFFGRPGMIGQRGANFIQQNSDFILILGARLDLAQVAYNYKNFAKNAIKVIVDIDEAEIAKMDMPIDISICTDARVFIREFIENRNLIESRNRSVWISRCKSWKESYPVILSEYKEQKGLVNTYALIDLLSELLTHDDILVPGSSGSCAEITMQAFRVKEGQRIINTPGLGSMGFGLPASIGVCLASGKKRTISIIGDGGLQHNIQELETIKRLNLPIILFILNNNGYASIRNTHNRIFEGRLVCCDPSSGLTLPDTCSIAKAYKIEFRKILNQDKLLEEVKKILYLQGPVVCEVMVDPDLQTSPRVSSMVNPDGSIQSMPMEDMWPFLEREQYLKNIIL